MIGLKILRHLPVLNQSMQTKTNRYLVTRFPTLGASRERLFASSSHWFINFILLFTVVVIGHCNLVWLV